MIVIPMAGLSRRFTDVGYRQPKYMLPLRGRTLFAHAVDSFRNYFSSESFLFIARDEQDTEAFIRRELESLQVANARVVILSAPTRGQAETVQMGLEQAAVDPGQPITIFNIDTFRPGFSYPSAAWMETADGYLEVMSSNDPGFSYAKPWGGTDASRVEATAEKQVISTLASTGLYWFRRAGDFLQVAQEAKASTGTQELYVAPLYNAMIGRGSDIRYEQVAERDVIFCGTPAQYEALLAA